MVILKKTRFAEQILIQFKNCTVKIKQNSESNTVLCSKYAISIQFMTRNNTNTYCELTTAADEGSYMSNAGFVRGRSAHIWIPCTRYFYIITVVHHCSGDPTQCLVYSEATEAKLSPSDPPVTLSSIFCQPVARCPRVCWCVRVRV